MAQRNRNTLIVIFLLITGTVVGGIYLLNSFLGALAPDKITISKNEIKSSGGFINPITIEKLKVDSIGEEQRPVKYVIEYLTTCSIKQPGDKPPVALNKIKLNEPGLYTWSEEKVYIPILHYDLSRSRTDSIESIIWSGGQQYFDICPIKFEPGNWYFITFLEPQIVGAYIYVDNMGILKQYMVYSGVSPI